MLAVSSVANRIDFRDIPVVPTSTELKDICLSKVQRKTPNEIHKQFNISRIRSFYMRKVKFLEQILTEKLIEIVERFPHVDKIHPFHADIINILYDRDHFKIALSQLNTCKNLIKSIGSDYIKLLKYGESAYRCKSLKVAAFGRMIKVVEKQKEALQYLESVRQHLTRLPRIDPSQRTIILTGFPNVGKSSFLNCITSANVDVQPYPFTTRSIYVGASEAFGLRWQILDTPGLLDKELDQRNSIEMLAISALAHLKACVIYFFDLSEQCGYSFDQQLSLFDSMKLLFHNKPLVVALNKSDQVKLMDLPQSVQDQLYSMTSAIKRDSSNTDNFNDHHLQADQNEKTIIDKDHNEKIKLKICSSIPIFEISTKENINIMKLKLEACKILLKQRIEMKLRSLKKAEHTAQLLKIHYPDDSDDYAQKRLNNKSSSSNTDNMEFDVEQFEKIAEKIIQNPRIMSKIDDQNDIYDTIPEFYLGYNVQDFVGNEVNDKISELIKEEEVRENNHFYSIPDIPDSEESLQRKELARMIKEHKLKSRRMSQLKNSRTNTNITSASKKALKPKLKAKERYFNILHKKDSSCFSTRPWQLEKQSNVPKGSLPTEDSETSKLQLADQQRHQSMTLMAKKSDQKLTKQIHREKQINYNRMPAHIFKGKANKKGRIF